MCLDATKPYELKLNEKSRAVDIPVTSVEGRSDTLLANTSLRLVHTEAQLGHGVTIVEGELGLERELLSGHDGV